MRGLITKFWVFGSLLVLLLCAGCSTTGGGSATNSVSQKPVETPTRGNDFLNVGDKVRVVLDIPVAPPPPTEMQIPENGELTLHLAEKFIFKDKKRNVLEQEIRDRYVERGYFKIINVTIEVLPRPITVGGGVRAPRDYAHQGQLTVLKTIDMAGGFTEYANKRKVKIIREGRTILVNCKKALEDPGKYDVAVFPGDTIHVPESPF